MGVRATIAVGLAAIVLGLVVFLLKSGEHRSGSDLTPNGAFIAVLGARQSTCQGQELIPGDTAAVRVTIATNGKPTPPMRLAISVAGHTLSTGSIAAGWREGRVRIPVEPVSEAHEGAIVCMTDEGPEAVVVAGALPYPGAHARVGPKTIEGRFRYDYLRPGRQTWFGLLPTIVHRTTIARAGVVRHWAWAAVIGLMLAAIALSCRVLLRRETL